MNKKKKLWKSLIILLFIALLISTAVLIKYRAEESQQNAAIDNQTDMKQTQTEEGQIDFQTLKASYPDLIAWLTLDGTIIDYPIVQGSDNAYYLNNDAGKNLNKNGALFLDYRNAHNFSDPNSIIYGHNMRSGDRMFSGLLAFTDRDYFDSHTAGWLYTPDQTYRLEIFAVYVTESLSNPYTLAFVNSIDFSKFIETIRYDTVFQRETDIQYGDRILTLSTCSYEFKDARTVIHAKLID